MTEEPGKKQETQRANLGRGDVEAKQTRVGVNFLAIDIAGIR